MGSFQRHWQRIVFALLMLAASLAGFQARAQGFGLAVSNAPAITFTNTPVLYTITVTNTIGGNLNDFEVTNVFSSNITLTGFTTNEANLNQVITTDNSILFTFTLFTNTEVETFSFTVTTATPGFLTNNITVATVLLTNTATSNVVNQIITAEADLAVSITGPPQAVITNDLSYYTVNVTNLGPSAVPNVFFTNTLPFGLTLRSVVPSSPSYTQIASNLVFSLGTLAASNGLSFLFNFQSTNVFNPTITASVGAAFSIDPNLANNTATTNFPIISYLPGQILAVTNGGQVYNPQNGFTEQNIMVTNTGTVDAPAVRLVCSGLRHPSFNFVGTNGTNPFVYLSAPLNTNQSALLRLLYYSGTNFPVTNSEFSAYAVPLPTWTAPAFTAKSTNIDITKIVRLTAGRFSTKLSTNDVLLEFPTTAGKYYTIVYADNVGFSNAMIAPPTFAAPANITQWIDYGPPETTNSPEAAGARFYRVYQNPSQ